MRILHTGPFEAGSFTESRRRAFEKLGHEVIGLDQVPYFRNPRLPFMIRKAQMHSHIGPGVWRYNRDIRKRARDAKPDLIYVDVGAHLWPETVADLRTTGAQIVHFTGENFAFRTYFYRHLFKAVPLYDVHVIVLPPSRPYLEERGARKIIMSAPAYDPDLHRPPRLTPEEEERYRADAVFIGHWEPATERMIRALRRGGVDAKVWGPGWRRAWRLPGRRAIRPLYGAEYPKALAAAKICLCFLAKWGNNTFSTCRTFEIPAVGSFLLAERTEDHLSYFREGEEAEFFGSPGELVEKARHYLAHEKERKAVARAGHQRCLTSGYSQMDRTQKLLEELR